MRSSVVESYSSSEFERQGSGYHMPFTPPPSRPAAKRPATNANTTKSKEQRRLVLAPAEGWLPLLLLAAAVYCIIYSMMAAHWVNHAFILYWSSGIGLLSGLLIAKTRRMPQVVLQLAACITGYWLSILLTSAVAFHVSWVVVLGNLRTAIMNGLTAGATTNTEMVFLFYLAFLCFYLGYFGTWLTYRVRLPWLVAVVYCSILLINLNYVKEDLPQLVVIMLAVLMLLVVRVQLAAQVAHWTSEGLYTTSSWLRRITWRFMQWAVIITLASLAISWVLPITAQPSAGADLWNHLDNAWTNISHGDVSLQNLSSIIQPYQTPANFFSDHLAITGSVALPAGEVLDYSSKAGAQYLEGFTFDRFDGHTWTTSPSGNQDFTANDPLPLDVQGVNYKRVMTEVTIVQPPEGPKHYIFAPAEPGGFDVATIVFSNGVASSWTQQSPLASGEHYQAISNVLAATAQELSAIPLPQQTPSAWASDPNYSMLMSLYLQVPQDLSRSVLATAEQWTQGATDSYTAVKMLESQLDNAEQFTYSVNNPAIPSNVDVVTWLLQTKQGYCTYYASAMTMMARLLGIPARMVNGFSGGHFDAQRKLWAVNGNDAHSWVQIYFPRYGWVDFDPTPGFELHNVSHGTQPPAGSAPHPRKPPTTPPGTNKLPHPRPNHPNRGGSSSTSVVADPSASQGFFLGLALMVLCCSILFLVFALCLLWWRKLYVGANFVAGMFWRACRIASWAGVPAQSWQTPYEYSSLLSQRFPREAAPLRRLTELFVRERWAASHEVPYAAEEDDLERLWPRLRSVLLRLCLFRLRRGKKGS